MKLYVLDLGKIVMRGDNPVEMCIRDRAHSPACPSRGTRSCRWRQWWPGWSLSLIHIFLGFPDVAGICLFSNLIADFSRLYPNVKLQIKENGSKRIMADVESGVLDVGCTVAPVPEDRFDVRPLIQDISYLVVSIHHPLAQRQTITLPELKDEQLSLIHICKKLILLFSLLLSYTFYRDT